MTPPATPARAKPPVKPRPKNAQKDCVLLFSEDDVDEHDLQAAHAPEDENPSTEADSPKVKKVRGKGKGKPVPMLVDDPDTEDQKSRKTRFSWNQYEDLLYFIYKNFPTFNRNPAVEVSDKTADQAHKISLFPPGMSLAEARVVRP